MELEDGTESSWLLVGPPVEQVLGSIDYSRASDSSGDSRGSGLDVRGMFGPEPAAAPASPFEGPAPLEE